MPLNSILSQNWEEIKLEGKRESFLLRYIHTNKAEKQKCKTETEFTLIKSRDFSD